MKEKKEQKREEEYNGGALNRTKGREKETRRRTS